MSISVRTLIEQAGGKSLVGEYVHVLIGGKRRTLEIVRVRNYSPRAIYVESGNGRLSLAENTQVSLQKSPFSGEDHFHGDYLV